MVVGLVTLLPFQPLMPLEDAVQVGVGVPVTVQLKVTDPPPNGRDAELGVNGEVNAGAPTWTCPAGHQPSLDVPTSATGSTVMSPVAGLTVTLPVTGMR